MGDQKVVLSLKNAGDKLEKPRQVDHWIYFDTKKDRDKFLEYIKSEKFKIEEHTGEKKDKNLTAHISRVDKVDLQSIYAITEHLRKIAAQFKGDYDGWETFVVKD